MSTNQPVLVPRTDIAEPSKQSKSFGITIPILFTAVVALQVALYSWPIRWLVSGVPELTFAILLGASYGYRVLPVVPLWTILTVLNLVYAVCATSWLLHGVLTAACWPALFLTCLFQFGQVARLVRKGLRKFLFQLDFIDDKIALFNLPALEIDTDVDGLMVVRGLTIQLSTLTIVAHGIEVGIKLSDDMELAISCEKVHIPLFRKIEIGDCFANLKGGQYEMTFGDMAEKTDDAEGDAVMVENTPLLQAAAAHGVNQRPHMVKMTSRFTGGEELKDSSATSVLKHLRHISPDDTSARKEYEETIKWIKETNTVEESRNTVIKRAEKAEAQGQDVEFEASRSQDLRAAICTQMHDKPTVPHPPKRSIKVTTLQNLSPPHVRRFMHRLPMLLRLLLNPLAYFHPVTINSITAAGSGRFVSHMLKTKIFKDYSDDNAELRRLEERILAWLSDAYFALELADITGLAQVPFLSAFDIVCYLGFGDVMAYRTLPKEVSLKQVIRLGGADATFTIPAFLLPHHEHLLPPKPTGKEKEELQEEIQEADGKPQTVRKEKEFEQADKDETNVKISAHARLPACLDQELINFVAALVKATKVVELEKAPSAMDEEVKGIKDFAHAINKGFKDSMKKTMVDGIVNDKLIARLVGKVTAKLEEMVGDVGYSGNIPVALEPYRLPDGHPEMLKLLS